MACAQPPAPPPRHPAILIGVDGLEWSVLLPLLHRGELPAMERLMERRMFGKLETLSPTISPVIWTTIATGKGPRQHGIRGFTYLDAETGGERLYTSGHRATKAFWNILSERRPDRSLHRLVEQVSGRGDLGDHGGPDQPPGSAGYRKRNLERLDRKRSRRAGMAAVSPGAGDVPRGASGRGARLGDRASTRELRARPVRARAATSGGHPLVLARRRRLSEDRGAHLDSAGSFDLLAIYLGSPDVTGHRFWRYVRLQEFSTPPMAEQIEI
jgi:hypothetical protein